MKQRTLKLTALFACAAMVMGSFAACGGGNDDVDPTPTPTPTQGAEDPTPTPVKYDFGGVKVKVFGSIWNDVENTENAVAMEAVATIEEKYGIDLVKADMSAAETEDKWDDVIITSVNAGDPCVDIITLNPENMLSSFMNGIMLDITDYVDDYKLGSIYVDAGTWQGKTYGISFDNLGDAWCLVYDREYVKQIGMEKTPTEMFMEGKWSYEDFKAYCADMKAKLPEGKYPIGQYPLHWGVMAAGANGTAIVDMDCNIGLMDEGNIEALQFYVDLENSGLAYPMRRYQKEDGSMATDCIYAVGAEEIVMARAEAWQLGGIEFDYGITFWPWGSQVECPGDYTTLSENYKVSVCYWGVDCIVADSCEKLGIPEEVMLQIMYDYRTLVSGTDFMHEAYESEQAGNPQYGAQFGEPRSFRTQEDIDLYDWAHSRFQADMGWATSSADLLDTWTATRDVLAEYKEVRSTMQSWYNSAVKAFEDAGVKLS